MAAGIREQTQAGQEGDRVVVASGGEPTDAGRWQAVAFVLSLLTSGCFLSAERRRQPPFGKLQLKTRRSLNTCGAFF